MNSSAKFSFMFVGVAALGAVAFACSVSTTTTDDVDGGNNVPNTSSSSSSSSSSTGGDTTVCPQYTGDIRIDSDTCNTCLLTKCCTETAGCFNYKDTDEDAGDPIGCDQYRVGLSRCDTDPGENTTVDQCKKFTKDSANTAVPPAYDTYLACRIANCTSECAGADAPDSGAAAH